MEITVNGEKMTLSSDVTTITHLVQYVGVRGPVVIVEQNGKILQQDDHANTEVKQGDCIELVQFVGGG